MGKDLTGKRDMLILQGYSNARSISIPTYFFPESQCLCSRSHSQHDTVDQCRLVQCEKIS